MEYKLGHRDARHAAADLVLERADELKALGATPAASSDAASTAEQVRTKLQEICDMQAENYGDALSTHIDLIGLCDEARKVLAAPEGAEGEQA